MASDTETSGEENDDNLKKLLEATDREFMNDSLYKTKKLNNGQPHNDREKNHLPSLRKTKDEDEDYNFFRVTPGTREYVAKQLDKRLEKLVKYSEKYNEGDEKTEKANSVKLFNNSVNFLCLEDENVINDIGRPKKRKLKMTVREGDGVNDYDRVKSVAVSPEDILEQKGTEQWAFKNKIFKYKKSEDGTLLSVE